MMVAIVSLAFVGLCFALLGAVMDRTDELDRRVSHIEKHWRE